jgi:peroxiredoxin
MKTGRLDLFHQVCGWARRAGLVAPAVLMLALLSTAQPLQTKPLTAFTGEPELLESGGAGVMFALTEEEYQKLAGQLTKIAAFVPMKRKPANLSAQARFGINFVLEERNLSWALDGDEKKGYVLYADLNANGDLSDDPPQQFAQQEGKHFLLFQTTARETRKAGQASAETYPVTFKLVVSQVPPPGQSQPQLSLSRYDGTLRRGALRIGEQEIAFGLMGSGGIYNYGYQSLLFDLNGDGKLDHPLERYLVSEKYVKLGETDYEYVVDRYGRQLTLKPLAEKLPPRVILLPGYPAPDFSFTDLEGKTRKLSDYRGQVVLLDFWSTWCGPCVASAPKLVEVYEKFQARGFEIIGIDSNDTPEKLRQFIGDKKMRWAQTMEEDNGPIHTLYRVIGWPTYYLIGQDGKIIANRIKVADLPAQLEKLLSAPEK